MDMDAEEDKENEEKFISKPYIATSSKSQKKTDKKTTESKKSDKKTSDIKQPTADTQMNIFSSMEDT